MSGRTRVANRTLRAALVESARGAIRKRDCYLAAQYRRLVNRRGDKKAVVAVAHSILVIAYPRPAERPVVPRAGRPLLRPPEHGAPHPLSHQAARRSWLHGDPRQARGLNHSFDPKITRRPAACDPTIVCPGGSRDPFVIQHMEDLVALRAELQETLKQLDVMQKEGLPSSIGSKAEADALESSLTAALEQVRAAKKNLK